MVGKNFGVIVTVVCALCALILIGDGITGFVVADQTTRPLCETDSDCSSPQVCCLFADATAGVCHDSSACGQVDMVTRKEYVADVQQPAPVQDGFLVEIAIGSCVLFLLLYVYYVRKIFLATPEADE